MLPRSSRATLRVVVLTLVRLVVLFVGALPGAASSFSTSTLTSQAFAPTPTLPTLTKPSWVVWAAAWPATGWLPLITELPREGGCSRRFLKIAYFQEALGFACGVWCLGQVCQEKASILWQRKRIRRSSSVRMKAPTFCCMHTAQLTRRCD